MTARREIEKLVVDFEAPPGRGVFSHLNSWPVCDCGHWKAVRILKGPAGF